jgi:hypothetical protein
MSRLKLRPTRPGKAREYKTKNPRPGKTGAGRRFEHSVPLAGGESSHGRSTLSAGPKAGQRASGGNRRHRPSGPFATATQDKRMAVVPHPRATRVRFEFARRAHQREITPNVGINLAERSCQGESDYWGEKSAKKFETGSRILSGVGISVISYEEASGSGRRAARQDAGAEILHPQRARVQNDNEHVVRTRVESEAADGLRRPCLLLQIRPGECFLAGMEERCRGEELALQEPIWRK